MEHAKKYWWVYLIGLVVVGAYADHIFTALQMSAMVALQVAGVVYLVQLAVRKTKSQRQRP